MLPDEQRKGHKDMLSAVLDTCVLWPALQRNFLLSLADEGAYSALWSEVILDELEYEVQHKWQLSEQWQEQNATAYARRLRKEMEKSFPGALVQEWEILEGTFDLPDPHDEHVVAAAVTGRAQFVVTSNLKDFPTDKLPGKLVAVSTSDFIQILVTAEPEPVVRAIHSMARRSGKYGPQHSVEDIARELAKRYGMESVNWMLGS